MSYFALAGAVVGFAAAVFVHGVAAAGAVELYKFFAVFFYNWHVAFGVAGHHAA